MSENTVKEIFFPVGHYKNVPYFMPPEGFDETAGMERLARSRRINAEFAAQFVPDSATEATYISGSFIYAQPPDYYGRPMLEASIEDWQKIFRRFRKMNIDTVIFQAALWKELNSCFYLSNACKDMQCFPVLEKMFAAAETENMQVYLGGYGSVAGWKENMSQAELQVELQCHKKCFEEISRLGRFAGMYFPAETAFGGVRQLAKEKRMNTLYRAFGDMVKEFDSDLKIITSPATRALPGTSEVFCDFWNNILADSAVDILMPQDSIGNGGNNLALMESQWQDWKSVADTQGITLWSHTEIFERKGYTVENNLYPAAPDRVQIQLAISGKYVEKHCCWEAISFTDPAIHGTTAEELKNFMEKPHR